MDIQLLGPVQLRRDGEVVDLPGTRPRLLLTALALAPNTVVPHEHLTRVLWDGRAPASARANLRSHASALRRAFGGRLSLRCGGYLLPVAPAELDVDTFGRLTGLGRRALATGDAAAARGYLRQALDLWRGPVGEGLPPRLALAGRFAALEEQRLLVEEDLVEAELAAGAHAGQVTVIRDLLAEHPLRERLWAALMVALYRCGDPAAALAAFAEARNRLAKGLGVDPGPRLQQLHLAVLNRDLERPVPRGRCLLPSRTALVERDAEVAEVAAALEPGGTGRAHLVVVHGPAGAGKSAVALRAAHEVGGSFPDGQLYLDLARSPDAARVLLRTLTGEDMLDAEAWWRAALTGRRMLVVLDHCRTVAALRPLLVAEPGCAFLVTADAPLAAVDAVARTYVGRLRTASAVRMLAALVGARVAREQRAAEGLVARCDHLALAVRAAAAVLISEPGLRLGELLERMTDARLLDELAVDDLDPRARLLARYEALLEVDPGAAATFLRARTMPVPGDELPPGVTRRLAEFGLLEGRRIGALSRLVTTPSTADPLRWPNARES